MKQTNEVKPHAGSEVLPRAGFGQQITRLFGVPQSRRLGLLLMLVLLFGTPIHACPMCKDSTVDTGKTAVTDSAGLNFNKSIYIMLGGFLTVVGFTGRVMYQAVKSSRL